MHRTANPPLTYNQRILLKTTLQGAFSFRASIGTFALSSGVNFLFVAFLIIIPKLFYF